ncbi:unnamed protein product, partial [Adineta steineri]
MFCLIFFLSLFSICNSIVIAKVQNHIIVDDMYNTLFDVTQDQCICEMIKVNDTISALNYFPTNQTCQLFRSNISTIYIEFYSNSTFVFLNQSSISILNIQEYGFTSLTSTMITTAAITTIAATITNSTATNISTETTASTSIETTTATTDTEITTTINKITTAVTTGWGRHYPLRIQLHLPVYVIHLASTIIQPNISTVAGFYNGSCP